MRYKKHKINLNDVEGNDRLSKSLGLYDISTAVTIFEEKNENFEELKDVVEKKVNIFCGSKSKWLVVAAHCDINVFDFTVGVEHKWTISFDENEKVVGLKFLPDEDVFIVILSTGVMAVCMPFNLLIKKESLLPPISKCSIAVVNEPEKYVICVLETQGSVYFFEMNKFTLAIKKEIDSLNAIKLNFSSEKINCHYVVWAMNCFAYFPLLKNENVKVSPIHCNSNHEFSDWFKLQDNLQVVRNVGQFIVVLTVKNKMIFYDLNLTKLYCLNIFFENSVNSRPGWIADQHSILDFEFLDVEDFSEFNPHIKVLFKVKMGDNYEFILRLLGDPAALFNILCTEELNLIPHATPGDDSNIVFVDAFSKTSSQNILIRFLSEAQSSLRLRRLLNYNRFEDALYFAKEHDLSLDIVYTAIIRKCQDQMQSESGYDENIFEEMYKYLTLLSDHDEACDFCIAALRVMGNYEHIVKILDFTQQKKINDEGTIAEISDFRYELATYRMLYSANNASYDQNSSWSLFLLTENHMILFDKFCEDGKIAEARIIYNRYPFEAQIHLALPETLNNLLEMFTKSVNENPKKHVEISEFIEANLLQHFLLNQDLNNVVLNCENLLDFLINTTKRLERIHAAGFPENSLFFALTFQRGLKKIKEDCLTADQQIEPIIILDKLDVDSCNENQATGRLNVLIKNLKNLVRIHRVYQCPMSYAEFVNRNVQTISYCIMDQVRTAQSVRDHIERFVFPYMNEHRLDKNDMLYKYIKQTAGNLYRVNTYISNSWDCDCLQIAESIADADLRCKAVIEIANASIPPWSEQLMAVVKNTLLNDEKIDPSLIQLLREGCRRAELGQIFVSYQIPLNFRTIVMDSISLKSLLQFMFKNCDKEIMVKLNDAFKVLTIYESLMNCSLISRIECYRLYAILIIMELNDEYELNNLINFFQLIKSIEERAEVAWKTVQHLKCLLVESKIGKIKSQRLIWLASLLCILERFVVKNFEVENIIEKTRNIRVLQIAHNLIIGFSTLENQSLCAQHLRNFINKSSAKKSLFEVVSFGRLFSLSLRNIFYTIVEIQIEKSLSEASMCTLEFFVERENFPELSDLEIFYRVYTSTLWNITNAAVDTGPELEPLGRIVNLFKNTLSIILDWSTKLQSVYYVEVFCKIYDYVYLLSHVLDRCLIDKCESIEHDEGKSLDDFEKLNKMDAVYTNRKRLGAFLPINEGSLFDHANIIQNIAIVASSVVKEPVEGELNVINFNQEMRSYWLRLYDSLRVHNLLDIYARQISYSLPCFRSVSDDSSMQAFPQCVSELLQKVLNVSTADLLLAAHLLLRLSLPNIKQVLQDLRRWVTSNRKSVRISLNVIRLSLFVLIESSDYSLRQQIAGMFETTLWQKRFIKLGILTLNFQQLRKENDLITEFVKVLIDPSIVKQFCNEMQISVKIILNYIIELCKISSSYIAKEKDRFYKTIDTIKAGFREIDVDEDAIQEIIIVIDQICPYNYEVLKLLLKWLEEWNDKKQLDYGVWIKDRLLLLNFLNYVKREKGYTQEEMKWYRSQSTNKSLDSSGSISTSGRCVSADEASLSEDDTDSVSANCVSVLLGGLYRKQDVFELNFPPSSIDRLPFHAFLVGPDQHDSLLIPIINNEINIYNVSKWTSLVKETSNGILAYSKTRLIITAIQSDVTDAIKYKRELLDYDLKQIRRLINDSPQRVTVLKALCQKIFRKLPLCDVKISIFQTCYDVVKECIDKWVDKCDENKNEYIAFCDALKRTLAQFMTDLLLSKNNFLNSNTSVLSHDAVKLISYVCSNCIDWHDNINIDQQFSVIEEIAKVNEVDLNLVYDELILSWLPGNENIEVGNTAHSDPDATIDFVGSDGGVNAAVVGQNSFIDEELPLPVLYSDPSLSKIVYLLKKCDLKQKARMIYHKFEQESTFTPNGFITKIRTACCLIRYLTNQQMHSILLMDKIQFCSRLIQLINHRLLSISRIGISIQDYLTTDKCEFAKSILSPQSCRQTPEVSYFLICVIIDNEIKDSVLIAKAAYRLLQLRMLKPLKILLNYTRKLADSKKISNIAMYYARVFEWMFDQISFDGENSNSEILEMIYHLIGCPVEGGSNFLRAKNLLARASCASNLIAIAGNTTYKVENIKLDKTSVDFDIKLSRSEI